MRIPLACLFVIAVVACGGDDTSDTDAASDAGGVLSIPTVCLHVCDTLFACTGMPADPECNVGCEADVIDCSAEQLRQLDACAGTVCPPGNPDPVVACLMAVGCVDM